MCARYFIDPDDESIREIVGEIQDSKLSGQFAAAGKEMKTSGEIRPGDVTPVIARNRGGKKTAFPMKWGYQTSGKGLLFNARSETAGEKAIFNESWLDHRCAVPASWYYEWKHLTDNGKQKIGEKCMIGALDSSSIWLTGIYRMENGLPSFTVLTREPTEELRTIHSRMPLILPEDLVNSWLQPDNRPEDFLKFAVTDFSIETA